MRTAGEMLERIEGDIRAEMERWSVPGIAIGILTPNSRATAGFGTANLNTGAPVNPDTLFQIGSISKVFTATLVMTLVDEGQLSLDQPVITWLPDLPLADATARRTITLRHLLSHMAGFYGDRFDDQGDGADALARAVAAFHDLPQQTAPGEVWTYCNAGFDLAGRVVEVIAGKPFETVMRERVFGPLGLPRATYFAAEAIRHSVAGGHIPRTDGSGELEVASPWPIPRRSGPAGAISATVDELLTFSAMHFTNGTTVDGATLVRPASAIAMRTLATPADPFRQWGLGWYGRRIGDTEVVEHNGATNGFMARLSTVPERGFAIAVLTNSASGSAAHTAISKLVLEREIDMVETDMPTIKWPQARMTSLAGTYRQRLGDLSLVPDGDGFVVQRISHSPFSGRSTPQPAIRFTPVTDLVMASSGSGTEGSYADWILDPDGSVRFLRFGGRLHFPGE